MRFRKPKFFPAAGAFSIRRAQHFCPTPQILNQFIQKSEMWQKQLAIPHLVCYDYIIFDILYPILPQPAKEKERNDGHQAERNGS
jgi:hypothetical protein